MPTYYSGERGTLRDWSSVQNVLPGERLTRYWGAGSPTSRMANVAAGVAHPTFQEDVLDAGLEKLKIK